METVMTTDSRSLRRSLTSTALAALLLGACTPGGGGGGSLSGTYVAQDPQGSMTLEFKSGGKVHLTMQPSGAQPEVSDGDYLIDGNHITIQVPGGMPISLVRNGKTLDADMLGQIMHFSKK
jgi:hypothetical protein